MRRQVEGVLAFVSAVAVLVGAAPLWAHGTTERLSLGPGGVQGDLNSILHPSISADGRFVAFGSFATNLVPGDTNGEGDVFVRDRKGRTTQRVSLGPGGVEGNGFSCCAALSANGRFVAFQSTAPNLVPDDTNDATDVFIRDRQAGTTRRVSLGPGDVQGDGFSGGAAAISADGRFVAFQSFATNLVPGDTNGEGDVFVRDRQIGATRRVSLGPGGVQSNSNSFNQALSADGRFVAFYSAATNLVPGDTNETGDVFVRDLQTGTTRRVSVGLGGVQADGESSSPALSADGRFIAFGSSATNLVEGDTNDRVDVFVRDRKGRTTQRVSRGSSGGQSNGSSVEPSISADGRFVAFFSLATNLVPDGTNGIPLVFVRDRKAVTTRLVSLGPGGFQADGESGGAAVSADGRYVAFWSGATNLVPGDTNGAYDVFLRSLAP